jgi:DNA-binding transcriptional ArsR family regulator
MFTSEKKTKPRKKMLLKEVKLEAFKLLADETRRKIMSLLRDRELNVCTIAAELNMTSQNIYHHMQKLENAGLIHVTREKRCDHLIESYYQATAENFICSTEELKGEPLKEDLMDTLNGLNKIGFKMEVNEEKVSELTELQQKRRKFTKLRSPVHEMCTKCSSTNFFLKFGQISPLKLDRIHHYANLIMMTDEEYEESIKHDRELRQFLRSICQKKPKK